VKKSGAVALATLAGFGIGTAWPGEPIHVAGKNICKTIEQHPVQVEGDPITFLIVLKGSCTTTARAGLQGLMAGSSLWSRLMTWPTAPG
jgi:hypothetical protein